jgi:hypothetical protein
MGIAHVLSRATEIKFERAILIPKTKDPHLIKREVSPR